MKDRDEMFETGKFYLINNRYDEALKIFEELLKEDQNNPDVLYHIGLIKEAKNELKEAKEMFLRTIQKQPKHKLAKKHLDKLLGIEDEQPKSK
ncbi:MAG: tetratricopeptide repeat protein [Endomicrobia bacterium]|nr:tetratricopeptide repeat protein [Endomicrobiia bacterium]